MSENAGFLEHEVVDGVHVLRLQAPRLENGTPVLTLEDELNRILEEAGEEPKVVINLASVEYLVTTALAKLISFRAKLVRLGGMLNLCNLQPAVQDVIRITHFEKLFGIYGSESEALAHVR